MLTFFARRIIGAILVMIAVTFIVFVIFIVVPGGDTAQRIAGKNATPQLIENVEKEWGFDKALPAQYWTQMKLIFTGQIIDYQDNLNVVSQFVHRNVTPEHNVQTIEQTDRVGPG